jgi:hypothetical protein
LTVTPRELLGRLGIAHAHRLIANALTGNGYRVKSVLRSEGDTPSWTVVLGLPKSDRGNSVQPQEPGTAQVLTRVQGAWPIRDLKISRRGQSARLTFLWSIPTPPGLLTLRPRGGEFLRRSDDGRWLNWRV